MFVYTIEDIIGIIVIAVLIIIFVISFIWCLIKRFIDKHFKNNCYDCKYWYLDNVAGAGGIGWYKCKKNYFKGTIEQEFNDSEHYEKCSEFERKGS